jgi:MATE family multidrug resistance protein
MQSLKNRWNREAGYREVLVIAIPLILSTASWSVQHFVDRMFLAWYSPETIAAAMPAGMVNFTMVAIFMGTAGYVNTFVAQYYGAKRFHRIGPALWQGVYISLIGGLLILMAIPFAGPVFRFVGHSPQIQQHEVEYFRILCTGGFFYISSFALSGFYSGRGKTWPVMWVNVLTTVVNLVLDYALIFGRWGLPELGIKGAGIATVAAGAFSFFLFLAILAGGNTNRTYHTLKGWRLDRELFVRLLRYGFPSGVQFFLEIAGFTGFVLVVGRLGTASLAATNIAFNINTLAFMPMIGFGIAISVLVGQYLGSDKPGLAQVATYSGFHLTLAYMVAIAAAYVLVPDIFVAPFAHNADPQSFGEIYRYSIILLRFVAVYSIFDALNIIFCSAIKGAGDTRYVMFVTVLLSVFVLIIPVYLVVEVLELGLMFAWVLATVYVTSLGVIFYLRFLGGQWKNMRVIEQEVPVPVPAPKPGPTKLGRVAKL